MSERKNKLRVGVIGGRSVVAGELLRLLVSHKNAEVTYVESSSMPGKHVEDEHPFLQGRLDLIFQSLDIESIKDNCDLVFISRPHMKSAELVESLLGNSFKIIDMGADFRLQDAALYPQWYNVKHPHPERLPNFVYGLSEINREKIAKARYVANPGCYPTSVILGCYPLISLKDWDLSKIIVDSYSGVSGAGKTYSDKNQFLNVYGNVLPYKFAEHPHTAEMEQTLGNCGKRSLKVLFFPHVMPVERGILSTVFVPTPKTSIGQDELFGLYRDFYSKDVFVRVVDHYPELKHVFYTNYCNISLKLDKRTGYLVITSVIDNTMKGAAGQGIQNMNIMEGFFEGEGL